MHVEIDQSGRIEETNRPTAIALANGVTASVRIAASEKRKALLALRLAKPQWSRRLIRVYVFSVLLYLLLRDHLEGLTLATIDTEYPGYEPVIKNRVLTLGWRDGLKIQKDRLAFRQIGKKSPAHKVAYRVYKGFEKPGRVISAADILAEFGE